MVFELGEVSIVGRAATPFDLELKVSQLYGSRHLFNVNLSRKNRFTNMLDKAYSYTEGYPAPGRQYLAALRYQFSTPPKKQP